MTNKILIGALAIFGILGLSFAWGGFMMHDPEIPDEAKEEFQQAFEDKDFETMRELREEYAPPINETLMEETDALREKIHDAMDSGDYETAQDLREELHELLPGPGFGHGPMGHGPMHGFGPESCNCPCAEEQGEFDS